MPEKYEKNEHLYNIANVFNRYLDSDNAVVPKFKYKKKLQTAVRTYRSQAYIVKETQASHYSNKLKEVANRLKDLPKNIDYSEDIETWKDFYKFPSKNMRDDHLSMFDEYKKYRVANESEETVKHLAEELIGYSHENKNPSTHHVTYLMGATGVGKTTYLKYFTKTTKNMFTKNKIISTRVKYRDLEKYVVLDRKKIQEDSLEIKASDPHFFEKYVVHCIFRDAVGDLLNLRWNKKDGGAEDDGLRRFLDGMVQKVVDKNDMYYDKAVSGLVKGDSALLNNFEEYEKIQLINMSHALGYKFCLILDGFDAISPEDIRLVRSAKDRLFIDLLSRALTNNFLMPHCDSGTCLRNIYIVMLVAVRPATLTDIKLNIQVDVDHENYISNESNWLVTGCELKKVMASRCFHYIYRSVKTKEDYDLLWAIIEYALSKIRIMYPSIEKNKFIDLFNHNAREKIQFLCAVMKYMIMKIEGKFHDDKIDSSGGDEKASLVLNDRQILSYLNNNAIECMPYELNYLLVLNSHGIFENHFIRDALGKYSLNPDRASIDNVFNYTMGGDYDVWTYNSDPLLVKYYLLRFLEKNGPTPVETVQEWITESARYTIPERELSFYIRAGFISIIFGDAGTYLKITKRGVFLISELIYSNVYFEHALLRALMPKFIADTIRPPIMADSRMWGLVSVFNMIRFLKYIKSVERVMRQSSDSIFNELPSIYPLLEYRIGDALMVILNEGVESASTLYMVELDSHLQLLEADVHAEAAR